MPDVIFQASDLTNTKRRQFLDAAKTGRAHLRDADGTSIVALPASDLEVLEQLAHWSAEHRRLVQLVDAGGQLGVATLGSLAWLRAFDRDDMRAFAEELQETLIIAMADNDAAPIREVVRAWRVTASQLEDPVRRAVLTGRFDPLSYVDAGSSRGE
ncbi:hypothetical protein CLV28_0065 [Sediminihabitans luteus]|uniref:Prevent-host-death family protein n=1 Tax=Sediminihabitans luteus TaxID=1138585 RepID=A0A2M9CY88_9CELL|nr:hypothetical protein [Sediminihabitans luteus]PJJ76857.1 hypothetical protein CLV28_0065 [Sediminihabitans luteus]GIJ00337.1 hypothetical protein Slu03_27140 [Sediminihabitans luteus]